MDFMLVAIFGKSCGIQIFPFNQMGWVCANQMNDTDPFGSGVGIISLGILFLALLCVPVGFWNLVRVI
jgi:hypothetical protein